ncbi:MAG: hypothetical protein EPO11_04790 [Gammaproteobacteria bacterium]|nr:MAG: hypothetical protein EPO11_04790 [Gammaproteobacteria bacterium]
MNEPNRDYCPHCYPAAPNHRQEKIDSLFDAYFSLPVGGAFFQRVGRAILRVVLHFSHFIQHAQFTDAIDRSQLNNGILVMWDEAKKRGLELFNIKFGEKHTQHFVLMLEGKRYYFDRSPICLVTEKVNQFADASKYDDKSYFKKILLQHDLPCPQGQAFFSAKKAFRYGMKLGFPLVVKPAIASFSRHASFNIKSEKGLRVAIDVAKQVNCRVVVEQYISGDVHRVTILNDKVIASTKRQAASVLGDGTSTIEELIDEKNNHPWRGAAAQLNCTLHKIEKNQHLSTFLATQGVNLKTKLKKGHRILLSNKMNNGNGAEVTNVTALIHPENEKLFLKLHHILNIPLSGIDFICQDVSLPWQEQPFAIIENNSLPYIDAHHYPSIGEPINAASYLWDFVLEMLLSPAASPLR